MAFMGAHLHVRGFGIWTMMYALSGPLADVAENVQSSESSNTPSKLA